MLDAMAGNRYFSVIDMKSVYHQVEIYEAQKERTVFTVGPFGLYEFNKMQFGLTGAAATYQRLMQDISGDYLKIFLFSLMTSSCFLGHLSNI